MVARAISLTREALEEKAQWVWEETLKIHRSSPETRVASSLSPIEIFVSLYYINIFSVFFLFSWVLLS